jgi:hypothetical protein
LGFGGQAILANYPMLVAFNFRRVGKVRLNSDPSRDGREARHLLVEIEAYYLLPRPGGRGRVTTERQIPGYFPVTWFVSQFRSGKFPGSINGK